MKTFHELMKEEEKKIAKPQPQPPRPKKRIVSLEEYRRLMNIIDNK